MNKKVIVQLIIIGIGIFCAYQAVSNLLNSFIYFVYSLKSNDNPAPWDYFINYILYAAIYTGLFFFLVKKNQKLADDILKNDPENNTSSGIIVSGNVVIYSILLSFALYGVLENIPFIINYCFNWFRFKITANQEVDGILLRQKENFITTLFYLLILAIVIYYLKPIAAYFHQKLDTKPVPENENIETVQHFGNNEN